MSTEQYRYSKAAMTERAAGLQRRAYTIPEFCATFNQSRSKAYAEIDAGRLKVRKVGKSALIAVEDAESWWQSFATQPEA